MAQQIEALIAGIAAEEGSTYQSASALYQGFLIRCRAQRLVGPLPDMTRFRRRFSIATAGLDRLEDGAREAVLNLAAAVEDDVLAPFLVIAAAASEGYPAPDENELARVYGTSSPGRIRRLLDHLERQGLIVVREDFGGERSILVPGLDSISA